MSITMYERAKLRLQAFAMLGRQDGWNYDPLQRKEKADELVKWALSDSIDKIHKSEVNKD